MMENPFNPDLLRTPDKACEPDIRSDCFVRRNLATGATRPLGLKDQHEAIAEITLDENVPENIRAQFETVRNLYLYSWFVYRFYPVCEHQAYSCLELALRERFDRFTEQHMKNKSGRHPTLYPLLKHAIDNAFIKNEGFETWRRRGEINSLQRLGYEKMMEMEEKGLKEISYDESEAKIMEEDLNWNYCAVLLETIPKLRNNYGHGTDMLHNTVLHTLQLVSEIINQIYQEEVSEALQSATYLKALEPHPQTSG